MLKPLGTAVTSFVSGTSLLNYVKLAVVASPFIVFLVQEVRMLWEVRAVIATEEKKRDDAVSKERELQIAIANARVKEVENKFLKNAFSTVEVVKEAADRTSRTPIDKEEVKALCDKDKQCRDRNRK